MEDRIIQVLNAALGIEDRTVEMTDVFRDYDEWDSLGRLSLIAEIDTEFEVQIEEKDFEQLNTVEDLMHEIQKRMADS